MSDETRPIRVNKEIAQQLKEFVVKNGGSVKKALEHGAIWVMSKGAKEYIQKLKK